MAELTGNPGFVPPTTEKVLSRRALAIERMATVSLTVSLVVAAAAVSLGNRSLAHGDLRAPAAAHMPVGVLLDRVDNSIWTGDQP
jgi:hypothetical protein